MNFTVRPQTGRDVHVEWCRISEAYAIAPDYRGSTNFGALKNYEDERHDGGGW
jgi:hypothetical protein